MTVAYERRLELAGSFNFRDLGGYETADGRIVRWRRLFRSDALHRLTPEDIQQLDEIGLTAVFDLRSSYELERDGLGSLFDGGVLHRHVPFHSNPAPRQPAELQIDLFTLYERMLEEAQPCVNAVFSALAEDETYPAVFHCAAGKDRTGIISGLVLSVLGVPDEDIITDYALTDGFMADRLAALRESAELDESYRNINPSWLRAEPATMAQTLTLIQAEHGSIVGFLLASGVTHVQLEAVRDHLLE
ncbi:tyrosine-protein phosphatase [soil metagenome]